MANQVNNQVSTFIPIGALEEEYAGIPLITGYLHPFSGVVAQRLDNRSELCLRVWREKTWCQTAVIIATYILSCGILPLVAAIATVISRCCYKLRWVDYPDPLIHIEQLTSNSAVEALITARPELIPALTSVGVTVVYRPAGPFFGR